VRNHTGRSEDGIMRFDPGIGVVPVPEPLGFRYERGTFGPRPETRTLDAIRPSLRDPGCTGPDPAYAIVMDIGREEIRADLERRMLLFGAVIYASGKLGEEPVRSQGHVHRISSHSGWSPPEVYEIWEGAAYVYMQERVADDPGRCHAVIAKPGDIVVVPPAWAHAAISADPSDFMALGALCDREYGFDYEGIRKRKGLAWYPIVTPHGGIEWVPNPNYQRTSLDVRRPSGYGELGFVRGSSLYEQAVRDLDRFAWISSPALCEEVWKHFEP
jgi:glucose-6-phosphate isomerase, archaeal